MDKLLRNERIRTTALTIYPLTTDPDRAGFGWTLTSDMSATQPHALPEAMASEAEISLGTALSKEASIQQIPDLHGTEHLGSVSRDY